MNESIVSVRYRIVGIEKFRGLGLKGYVAVFLEPVKPLKNYHKSSPVRVKGNVPKEVLSGISMMIESAIPPGWRGEDYEEDPRSIVHIEPVIDFTLRNWKFGDIVDVRIEKVKDAKDIDPVQLEG